MSFCLVSSLYFSFLCQFSFVSHPIVYCFLLLGSSLSAAFLLFHLLGFSWYIALFCLVYIGGVYILFIFISVHTPNPVPFLGVSLPVFFVCFTLFFIIFSFYSLGVPVEYDNSHFLCSYFEGFTYCLFCSILLIGFFIISLVSSDKGSFYR